MGGPWRAVKDESKARARAKRLEEEIYFVEDAEGHIKIGRAIDVYTRVAMLQNGHARPVKLLARMPGAAAEERALHERFRAAHVRGEWFLGVHELRSFIAALENGASVDVGAHPQVPLFGKGGS